MELIHSLIPQGKKTPLCIINCILRLSLIHFVAGMGEEEEKEMVKKDHIPAREEECAGLGQQSRLFEMSVSLCTTASESRTEPSTILISCLTKSSVPHGKGEKGALSCLILSVTSVS